MPTVITQADIDAMNERELTNEARRRVVALTGIANQAGIHGPHSYAHDANFSTLNLRIGTLGQLIDHKMIEIPDGLEEI